MMKKNLEEEAPVGFCEASVGEPTIKDLLKGKTDGEKKI
jgi:hypothetical protein